jgi:hypothetical protein
MVQIKYNDEKQMFYLRLELKICVSALACMYLELFGSTYATIIL